MSPRTRSWSAGCPGGGGLEGPTPGVAGVAAGVGRVRPLVVIEAQPGERIQDRLLGALHVARAVRVLEADDEGAALVASEQPVEEGGADVADVGLAGGGGCVTDAYGHGGANSSRTW